jgi:hypothetical protein
MTCAYCGNPATHLDLCHAGHPVCDEHLGLGHQLEKLPPPESKVTPPKPAPRTRP